MDFLAGVMRFDGEIIPDFWNERLKGGATAPLRSIVIRHGEGLFLAPEAAIIELPDGGINICHNIPSKDALPGTEGDYSNIDDALFEGLITEITLAAWRPQNNSLSLIRLSLTASPIFFIAQDKVFAFSTKLSSLLALPFVSNDLNEPAICRNLCFDASAPADETYYSVIRRLPAAHRLTVERGQVSIQPIPKFLSQRATEVKPTGEQDSDHAEMIRSLLIEAVERRIDPGKTIAVHLSGGLDSSAIACIAARYLKLQGRRLIALCSVLPRGHIGPETDEHSFIEAVLAQEDNIDPVWVEAPADEDPFAALPRWFENIQEPPFNNVTHIEMLLGEAGRAHGVEIVLSGFGGDFFISAPSEPTTSELLSAGRWRKAAANFFRRHLSRCKASLLSVGDMLRSLLSAPLEKYTGAAVVEFINRIEKNEFRRPVSSLKSLSRLSLRDNMRFLLEPGRLERSVPQTIQVYQELFHQDLRFPLLDPKLIDAVMELDEAEFRRGGESRGLMRWAITGIVPEKIRQRPDKGPAFDPALASHCAKAGPALRQWIGTASPKCWEYVDKDKVLETLNMVAPSNRAGWRMDMFTILLTGVRIAKFVDWRLRTGDHS